MDPARRNITAAIDVATENVDNTTQALLRHICGGCSWHDERVRALRSKLAAALNDLAVAKVVLRELDILDGIAEEP